MSQAQALVPLVLAPGSERFHVVWMEHATGVTVRRLEDDVDHALASSAFDPALRPDFPEGVQIGAEHRAGQGTDVWVANVPADVGRCTVPGCTSYRNLHAHHQRGVHAGVIRISGRAPDALLFELPLRRFRSGDRCATLPP